jgi:hypothetical protein
MSMSESALPHDRRTRLAVFAGTLTLVGNAAAQFPGDVLAWGSNGSGQCAPPPMIGNIVQVAGGGEHGAAINRLGGLFMWGDNAQGQCDVPDGLRVTAVALGQSHTVVLANGSSVQCWGRNWEGQCNVPSYMGNVIAVSAGSYHSLALTEDRLVFSWGSSWLGDIPKAIHGRATAIDGGNHHSLALLDDGTVGAWGQHWWGVTDVPAKLDGVTAIAAGHDFSLALRNDGSIVAWGSNDFGQCNVPSWHGPFAKIDAGARHAVALTAAGTVVAWGLDADGQASVPPHPASPGAVAAGASHTLTSKAPAPPGGPPTERWVAPVGGHGLPTIQQAIDQTATNVPLRLYLVPGTYLGTGDAVALAVDRTVELISPHGAGAVTIDGENVRRGILHLGSEATSLVVRGITFVRCRGRALGQPFHVDSAGGAIRSSHGAELVVENCRFLDCMPAKGDTSSASRGTGILYTGPWGRVTEATPNPAPRQIRVSGCLFERCDQGAVVIAGWRPLIESSAFRDCRLGWGAAVTSSGITLRSCSFESNAGTDLGGAVCLWYGYQPSLVEDCTFVGNRSMRGGAMFVSRSLSAEPATRTMIRGCTFIDNHATAGSGGSGSGGGGAILTGACTDIEDCTFVGNTSIFGRAISEWQHWLPPIRISGCTFDTCCPAWPLDRVQWGPGNAYQPRCVDCLGDVECDGLVDGIDLGVLLSRWGPASPDDHADIDGDGAVDGIDLGLLLASWGGCPQG